MEFCPQCGSLLVPENQDGQRVLTCRRCCTSKDASDSKATYIMSKEMGERDNVVVIKEEVVPYPTTRASCRKCGNAEAYYYSVQTRGGDESETVYMTCTKCKHVWKVTS